MLKNFISCCLTQVKEKLTPLRREEKCLGLAVVDDHDVAAVVIFEALLVVVDTVVIVVDEQFLLLYLEDVITASLIGVDQDKFVVNCVVYGVVVTAAVGVGIVATSHYCFKRQKHFDVFDVFC